LIDNRDQVERLARQAHRVPAAVGARNPALMATLCERSSTTKITLDCTVTEVMYMGDEGGVMCHLTFDEKDATEVFPHVNHPPCL